MDITFINLFNPHEVCAEALKFRKRAEVRHFPKLSNGPQHSEGQMDNYQLRRMLLSRLRGASRDYTRVAAILETETLPRVSGS